METSLTGIAVVDREGMIAFSNSRAEQELGLFYKIDRKSEGTGAGLAIIKRIHQ